MCQNHYSHIIYLVPHKMAQKRTNFEINVWHDVNLYSDGRPAEYLLLVQTAQPKSLWGPKARLSGEVKFPDSPFKELMDKNNLKSGPYIAGPASLA